MKPRSLRSQSARRGIALVLVLVFLVLISGLVLGLFSSSQTELSSATSYANNVSTRQLADAAVNIVQAQISDGTKSYEIVDDPATVAIDPKGKRLTWASQPGLIRSFDDSGNGVHVFKLFSARNMTENKGFDYVPKDQRAEEIDGRWPSKIAEFVDLNEPVIVKDPLGKIVRDEQRYSASYPILDPGGLGLIEGFRVNLSKSPGGPTTDPLLPDPVPGYGGSVATTNGKFPEDYDPGLAVKEGQTNNPVPMPVRWLYVLANGKMTAADGTDATDDKKVTWRPSLPEYVRPTPDNPIVGRIAFWTDDETCKLNINTATEGVYWDRPWANSTSTGSPFTELQLARRIPAKNEYNRFPGHPATTCLSPVLAGLMPSSTYVVPSKVPEPNEVLGVPADTYEKASYPAKFLAYYDLAPRVGFNGSRAGTVDTVSNGPDADYTSIILDQNRLYGSIDELIFKSPDGRDSAILSNPSNMSPRGNNPGFNRAVLERAKFFLTASSRAPELNLFSQPRVSLWPLQVDPDPNVGKGGCPPTVRNAKDKLIAACGTVGSGTASQIFYFQRASIYLREQVNNRVNHRDVPFLQLPPAYAPPSSQHPSLDWTGVPRNRELYRYLQKVTNRRIPGFGESLAEKYFTPSPTSPTIIERDQILTEMIDLARSGVNTYSTDSQLPPRYEYAPARDMPDATSGETQLVPLVPPADDAIAGATKGIGRFPTITEAAFLFYRANGPTPGQDGIRVVFIPEMASPTCGPASWSPLVRFRVKGLDKVRIFKDGGVGTPIFASDLTSLITSRAGYSSGSNHSTAFNGLQMNFRIWNGPGQDMNKRFLTSAEAQNLLGLPPPPPLPDTRYHQEKDYPFISTFVPVEAGQTTFNFSASEDIVFEVHSGYGKESEVNLPSTNGAVNLSPSLVQTLRFKFPVGRWNLPTAAEREMNTRLGSGLGNVINTGADVVRSVELDPKGPSKGDLRLLAALRDVPSSFFAAFPGSPEDGAGYADTGAHMVHSLRLGANMVYGGRSTSRLVASRSTDPKPVAARGMAAALNADGKPGDWDNGNGSLEDGAYINKPDEGNAATADGGYFATGSFNTEKTDTFSPNRQVTSAVMFGSLPTGVFSQQPWQTLLFCPVPASATLGLNSNPIHPSRNPNLHNGHTGPRDHLFLDLFTMPVVEPYAISEPCSTAGKVNLNYQLAPFTYIHRSTALRGVLKSTKVTAIPSATGNYKSSASGTIYRKAIRPADTLRFFEERFAKKTPSGTYQGDTGVFRSATEICDMPLVPEGGTYQTIKDGVFWNANQMTGDNAREIPYGHIYPRVTTKSNTFTVHMRVQVLKKRRPPTNLSGAELVAWNCEWTEGKDQVVSEYRGSATLERYIDPSDPRLPDFIKNEDATMDEYYRFRIVSTKRFQP